MNTIELTRRLAWTVAAACVAFAACPAVGATVAELDQAIGKTEAQIRRTEGELRKAKEAITEREIEQVALSDKLAAYAQKVKPLEDRLAGLKVQRKKLAQSLPDEIARTRGMQLLDRAFNSTDRDKLVKLDEQIEEAEKALDRAVADVDQEVLADEFLKTVKVLDYEGLKEESAARQDDPKLLTLKYTVKRATAELERLQSLLKDLKGRRARVARGERDPVEPPGPSSQEGPRFLLWWQMPTPGGEQDIPIPEESNPRWYAGSPLIVRLAPDHPDGRAYLDLLAARGGSSVGDALNRFAAALNALGDLMSAGQSENFRKGALLACDGTYMARVDCGGQSRYRFIRCTDGTDRGLGNMIFYGLKPGINEATLTVATSDGKRVTSRKLVEVHYKPKVDHVWKAAPTTQPDEKPKGVMMPVTVTLAYARSRAAAVGREEQERWSKIGQPKKKPVRTGPPTDNERFGVPSSREEFLGSAYVPPTPGGLERAKYRARLDSLKKFEEVYDMLNSLPGVTAGDLDGMLRQEAELFATLLDGADWDNESLNPTGSMFAVGAHGINTGTEAAYTALKSVLDKVKGTGGIPPKTRLMLIDLFTGAMVSASIQQKQWARAVKDHREMWVLAAAIEPGKYKADQPPAWWPGPEELEALAARLDAAAR